MDRSSKDKSYKAKKETLLKGKTLTASHHNERQTQLEEQIRQRVALEERAFRLIESLLDNPVTEQQLLEAAKFIEPNHYKDVVDERAIIQQCGYPVCGQSLMKVPNKKYHISLRDKQVYDITDRKKFCSNQCYTGSQYFERQLSNTALWLRDDEGQPSYHLMPNNKNKGAAGEVVLALPSEAIKQEINKDRNNDETPIDEISAELASMGIKSSPADNESGGTMRNVNDTEHLSADDAISEGKVESNVAVFEKRSVCDESTCVEITRQLEQRLEEKRLHLNPQPPPITNCDYGTHDTATYAAKSNVVKDIPSKHTDDFSLIEGRNIQRQVLTSPVVSTEGHKSKQTAENSAEKKRNVLMELLDKRERLEAKLHSEKSSETSGNVIPTQPTITSSPKMILQTNTNVRPGKRSRRADVLQNIKRLQESETERQQVYLAESERASEKTSDSSSDTGSTAKSAGKKKRPPKLSVLDVINNTFHGWKTPDTVEFLIVQQKQSEEGDTGISKEEFRRKYAELSKKVDANMWQEELLGENKVTEDRGVCGRLPDYNELAQRTRTADLRVREFYKGSIKVSLDESNHLSSTKKQKQQGENSEAVDNDEIVLPFIDCYSQVSIRRKIVLDKLSKVLPDLLAPLQLNMNDVSADIRNLIYTFNLTSENILLKPAHWILVGYIILQLLSVKRRRLRDVFKEEYAVHYFTSFILTTGLTMTQIHALVTSLTSL